MALVLKEFTIGTLHTISIGNYENIKVEASITCGCKIGCTDEEFHEIMTEAQAKLKEILKETYLTQRRPKRINDQPSKPAQE